MNRLSNEEMMLVNGGSLSGTVLNAFVRGISKIFEIGQSFGSAIRRAFGKNICPIS